MQFLGRLAFAAVLAATPLLAQTTTKGTVGSITYNADGEAISFVLDVSPGTGEVTFTIDSPSEQMTQDLQRWKDKDIKIAVTDQDNDHVIEDGDTIAE